VFNAHIRACLLDTTSDDHCSSTHLCDPLSSSDDRGVETIPESNAAPNQNWRISGVPPMSDEDPSDQRSHHPSQIDVNISQEPLAKDEDEDVKNPAKSGASFALTSRSSCVLCF
jgi:hypothetical protein